MRVMMAVGFAVGGDMHQLRPVALVGKAAYEALAESFAVRQQTFERDRARDRAIVEEKIDGAPRGQTHDIRPCRINARAFHIAVTSASDPPHLACLMRSQDRVFDPQFGKDVESLNIRGSLRQPHAFGVAAEAMLKIANAPYDLRALVAAVRQRQDYVVVGLRNRRTVTRKRLLAFTISIQDRLVGLGRILFQPRQKSRPEVEADSGIVVDDFLDSIVSVENARRGVGRVTLRRDALVPVVVWVGRVL